MIDQGFTLGFNEINNRIKPRIIYQNKITIFILKCHANIFPDLHGNSSCFETSSKPINCLLFPVRFTKTIHGESSGKSNGFSMFFIEVFGIIKFLFNHRLWRRPCHQCHQFKIVFFNNFHKRII